MSSHRERIEQALLKLAQRQRSLDFQALATHLYSDRFPFLVAAEWNHDGGEDAFTLPISLGDHQKVSFACSLTATLSKVKQDCDRIKQRQAEVDLLVFITSGYVERTTVDKWKQEIRPKYGFDLEVISRNAIVQDLEKPVHHWICREYLEIELSPPTNQDNVLSRAIQGANANLQEWRAQYGIQEDRLINLSLRIDQTSSTLTISDRVNLIEITKAARRIIIQAEGGAGKTVTLWQLAATLGTATHDYIPVLASLADWALTANDFVQCAANQINITSEELLSLQGTGRIVFLLNGWNEIGGATLDQTASFLRDLVLKFRDSCFIVATRQRDIPPPLQAAVTLNIEPLSDDQRRQIVEQNHFPNPEAIIEKIEESRSVDSLTRIPLFLSTVLALARRGDNVPILRSQLLESFINQAEQEHRLPLTRICGRHSRRYLRTLAADMTSADSTTFTIEEALKSIGKCIGELSSENLIGVRPEASEIIEVLIGCSVLVHSLRFPATIRFNHQLFQEWFASDWLGGKITEIIRLHDQEMLAEFRKIILDKTAWEEALILVAERLGQDHPHIPAELVRWSIPLDLVFASRLAHASGVGTWILVRDEISRCIRELYGDTSSDAKIYSVSAILATGAPDFADIVWDLLEDSNGPWQRFPFSRSGLLRLSALGEDYQCKYLSHTEDWRTHFVSGFCHDCAPGERQAFIETIMLDSSPKVRTAAIEAFAFEGEHRLAWSLLDLNKLGDTRLSLLLDVFPFRWITRLLPSLPETIKSITNNFDRVESLLTLQRLGALPTSQLLIEELSTIDNPHQLREIVPILARENPTLIGDWMIRSTMEGREIDKWLLDECHSASPSSIEELRKSVTPDICENGAGDQRLRVWLNVDPLGASLHLFSILLESIALLHEPPSPARSTLDQLENIFRAQPWAIRAEVILTSISEVTSTDKINLCVDLLRPERASDRSEPETLPQPIRRRLRDQVLSWYSSLGDSLSQRRQMRSSLAELLGNVGNDEDAFRIEDWLKDDRNDISAQDQHAKRHNAMRYHNLYVRALVDIGSTQAETVLFHFLNDPEYFGEASAGLASLAQKQFPPTEPEGLPWRRDYGRIIQKRKKRYGGSSDVRTSSVEKYVTAIRDHFKEFLGQRHDRLIMPHDLGSAARALADLGDEGAITLILQLVDIKYCDYAVVDALERLLFEGYRLPDTETKEAMDLLIERVENPSHWSNDDPWDFEFRCIAIELHSDEPVNGIMQIRRLFPRLRNTWRMRELIQLLRSSQSAASTVLLLEWFYENDLREQWYVELLVALSRNWSSAVRDKFLEVTGGMLDGGLVKVDHLRLVRILAQISGDDPDFLAYLCSRVSARLTANEREILASVLHEVGKQSAVLASCQLIDDNSGNSVPYGVERGIEEAFTVHKPTGRSDSYYIVPQSFNAARQKLFQMMLHDRARSRSARQLLLKIENQRFEIGRPPDEPRHPDLEHMVRNGLPWVVTRIDAFQS